MRERVRTGLIILKDKRERARTGSTILKDERKGKDWVNNLKG